MLRTKQMVPSTIRHGGQDVQCTKKGNIIGVGVQLTVGQV